MNKINVYTTERECGVFQFSFYFFFSSRQKRNKASLADFILHTFLNVMSLAYSSRKNNFFVVRSLRWMIIKWSLISTTTMLQTRNSSADRSPSKALALKQQKCARSTSAENLLTFPKTLHFIVVVAQLFYT